MYEYYEKMIDSYKNFLFKKGIKMLKKRGLEIKIGEEVLTFDHAKGRIELPAFENKVNATKLILLASEKYPKIAEKYLSFKENLERLKSTC